MTYQSDYHHALIEYRAAVRALPDGWRMTDKVPHAPDAARTVAELLQLMDQPVPVRWRKADAEHVLDLIADWLVGATDQELAEVGKTFAGRQVQSVAAAATTAKRRAVLSPLQANVLALERQLGASATDRQISDALAERGRNTSSPSNVNHARRALRSKGY